MANATLQVKLNLSTHVTLIVIELHSLKVHSKFDLNFVAQAGRRNISLPVADLHHLVAIVRNQPREHSSASWPGYAFVQFKNFSTFGVHRYHPKIKFKRIISMIHFLHDRYSQGRLVLVANNICPL